MGAWSDLSLDLSTLEGVAPLDFDGSVFVEEDREVAAKRLVQTLLARRAASYVALAGSTEAWFDLAAANAALAPDLQLALGYAYLYAFYLDRGSRPGRGSHDRQKALTYYDASGVRATGLLVDAVAALAEVAPVVLGQTTRAGGSGGSGALVSTMDRYRPTSAVGQTAGAGVVPPNVL